MKGALPPSSSDIFLMVPAACSIRILPTRVDPVKVILRTLGLEQSSFPTPEASVDGITLNTPAGMPARSPRTAMANADKGVSSAGRATKVQPAASAGPTLRAIIALGKFHGVIDPTTPTGCFSTMIRLSRWWPGMTSP